MSVALRRVDGIVSAEVRLNSGVAEVRLAPGNRLDPEQLRTVIRDHGFTPRGAEVIVRGRLEGDEGAQILRVDGPDLAFHLDSVPAAEGSPDGLLGLSQGSRVEVRAEWPQSEPTHPDPQTRVLRLRSLRPLGPEE